MGVSFSDWLIHQRIELAQQLLESTNDTIEAIAFRAAAPAFCIQSEDFSRALPQVIFERHGITDSGQARSARLRRYASMLDTLSRLQAFRLHSQPKKPLPQLHNFLVNRRREGARLRRNKLNEAPAKALSRIFSRVGMGYDRRQRSWRASEMIDSF